MVTINGIVSNRTRRATALCTAAAAAAVSLIAVLDSPAGAASSTTPGTVTTRNAAPNVTGNGLNPFVTATGRVYMSEDAIGTNDPSGGPVRVHKNNASSTVLHAYVLAASTPGGAVNNGDVTLNGTALTFPAANRVTGNFGANSVWTDVTSLVKPVVDAAPAGNVSFVTAEPTNTFGIDGEILAVIMTDPTLPSNNTVSFEFGALNTSGDTYSIGLASPLDTSDPNLALTMSIGDSYSYQQQGASQYSVLKVNGSTLTSSAGGNDDAVTKYDASPDYTDAGNGELITVGGIGDSSANPPDPNATSNDCAGGPPRCDDELYSLLPFVHNGDTSITVNSLNPSANDNIFFTGFQLNSAAAVVGEGAVLAPISGTSPIGTPYTFTTKLQDNNGQPIGSKAVKFTVLSGPNAGLTHNATTDSTGGATFVDTSASAGTDTVQVSFVDASGSTVLSNQATVDWTMTGTNHPPVAMNSSVSTPRNTPVGVTLSATDADSDPLTYAVVTPPAHGTLTGTAPNLTYTPANGYNGADSFTFKANDGRADSNVATVSITVTCPSSSAPTVDVKKFADSASASTLTAPALTTSAPKELLVAYVEAGGSTTATQKVTSLTGGGLTWRLAARSNSGGGTSEVWSAMTGARVSNVSVAATLAKAGYAGSISVVAFRNATGIGSVATTSGRASAPSAALTATAAKSTVWAAGYSTGTGTAATPGSGQAVVHQSVDSASKSGFWTQFVTGSTVAHAKTTVSDSKPSGDRWTMSAVEILAATSCTVS